MIARLATLVIILSILMSTAFAAGPDPVQPLREQMAAARSTLVEHYKEVNARSGLASALVQRMDEDAVGLEPAAKPTWMSDADFMQNNILLVRLDASLIGQLASGAYHSLAAVRGADDTVFKSPADGTVQPLGVYVPASYDPRKPSSLVVFLHGRTWSENDIIANPWVRAAADASSAIVIAPYARGDVEYADPASADVYAALDAAEKAFNVDRRRVYLAGHSMGGYGVFIVGPKHPENWAAILAASGGMTTETRDAALKGLQHIPVYLVAGSQDPIVPKGYMRRNAELLSSSGIEAHYYEEPGGLHSIGSFGKSFERAWRDMLTRSSATPVEESPSSIPGPQAPSPSSRD